MRGEGGREGKGRVGGGWGCGESGGVVRRLEWVEGGWVGGGGDGRVVGESGGDERGLECGGEGSGEWVVGRG